MGIVGGGLSARQLLFPPGNSPFHSFLPQPFSTISTTPSCSQQHQKDLKNSFNLAATIKNNDASPRDFVPFYVGSELRAFRLRDHKIHFVTEGAFGAPPKRKIHLPPVLINLKKNQEEDFRNSIENDELLESLLQRVNEFNNSIIRKSSIFDVQYE